MRRVYSQKNLSLTIDGTTIQDFHEGATVTYVYDGGEVDKTQGTDGASINLATPQGATVHFTVRETSRSREFLHGLVERQRNGGPGVTVILRTGADVIHSLTDAYIGPPGELSSGDKKQGGLQFTLMSADDDTSNLSNVGSVGGVIQPFF